MSTTSTKKNATSARLKFYDRIVRDPGVSGMAAKAAWRLVDRINDETGLCCPSIALLARELGVSQRTIQRALDQLINRNWISKRRRGYRGTQYVPNYEWRMDAPVGENETNWTNSPEKPDKNDRKIRSGMSTEPTQKHTSEPSEEQEDVCKAGFVGESSLHADPSASSVWNAHRDELIATIGEGDFVIWLDPLTPVSDDGSVLVLAAATQFSVERITMHFRDILERILGRKVVVVARSWASKVYSRRQAERAVTSTARGIAVAPDPIGGSNV